MRIRSSSFVRSAYNPGDEPLDPGPDVVFMGRSNVGKSSLINRLLGVRGLAKTSSTPGRTQCVNFYRVNGSVFFIDLPGYGYAKVPEKVRKNWGPMIEGFLERRRERIAMAVLVMDARHDPTSMDGTMRDWLEAAGLNYLPAITKADKLSGNGRTAAEKMMRGFFEGHPFALKPVMVSARTGLGMKQVWHHMDKVLL